MIATTANTPAAVMKTARWIATKMKYLTIGLKIAKKKQRDANGLTFAVDFLNFNLEGYPMNVSYNSQVGLDKNGNRVGRIQFETNDRACFTLVENVIRFCIDTANKINKEETKNENSR